MHVQTNIHVHMYIYYAHTCHVTNMLTLPRSEVKVKSFNFTNV